MVSGSDTYKSREDAKASEAGARRHTADSTGAKSCPDSSRPRAYIRKLHTAAPACRSRTSTGPYASGWNGRRCSRARGPDCWFVVSLRAVRRVFGDRARMRAQLEHVKEHSR
ncbi:Scr1 family TA system antitoxin-like transcriptional regulator [Streptomyces sp. BK79]|uniref:Scr1 family TA system antitoxin-like transcriptional regulator n=1 Tax=Streptomyces sp. BK79 TaxID=3350097 RepID=UPI00376F772C